LANTTCANGYCRRWSEADPPARRDDGSQVYATDSRIRALQILVWLGSNSSPFSPCESTFDVRSQLDRELDGSAANFRARNAPISARCV